MKTTLYSIALLLLFAPLTMQAKTVYPLYAISSTYTPLTADDTQMIANNFQLFRADGLKRIDIDALHAINPNLRTLLYVDSGSALYISAPDFEQNYRTQISMYHIAKLATNISATQTTFNLQPETDALIALKKSTIDGDYSESNKKYVIWIRIDNELMKVIDFNRTTNVVSVIRGFSGSTNTAHSSNAFVFTTVYVDPRTVPDGNDPQNRLRYSIDVSSPFAIKMLVNSTYNALMKRNYDGAWYDVFSASNYNHQNMFGRGVPYMWDFSINAYAVPERKRELQEIRLNAIQNQLFDLLKKVPPIYANRMGQEQYWPGSGNTRLLLMSTQIKPRPLDGYCIENFVGAVNGRGNRPIYRTGTSWINMMKMLMDASQKGLAALPMLADAGYWSLEIEPAGPIRDAFETYGYASFLLAVEKNSKIMLGIPAYYFYTDQNVRKAWVHPRYSWAIGAPLETQTPAHILNYRPKDHQTFIRHFAKGLVLVNPSEQEDVINLETTYYDPDAKKSVNSIIMAPETGKILLKLKDSER